MKKIPSKAVMLIKRKAPTILTGLSILGVVATTVSAIKVTPKAIDILRDEETEKGETLSTLEKINTVGLIYIPTVIFGVSTIVCMLGANILNKRNQASLAGAYALLNNSYHKYRKAASDIYGENADEQIRAQVAKDTFVSAGYFELYSPEITACDEKILCYDTFSERYFEASVPAVLSAEYHVNRNLQLRGDCPVNEFYDFLGIDRIEGGFDIGWSMEELFNSGLMWLDFGNEYTKNENRKCFVIRYAIMPDVLTLY
ncbi:MAG: DUF6353 family protein [Oscillospiraceae bacterium]|jgi:hypothetical protein|nr:DUF6353 family protein [Oscillospiraceae bacterium]